MGSLKEHFYSLFCPRLLVRRNKRLGEPSNIHLNVSNKKHCYYCFFLHSVHFLWDLVSDVHPFFNPEALIVCQKCG